MDFIICENPKHSLKLLNNKGIKKKLFSLHDHNEEKVIKFVSKKAKNSKIALISDAGSPLISDPGFKLVRYYLEKDMYVTSIPGPSSIITSLQLSGLPINNFAFYGFAPKSDLRLKYFVDKINNAGLTAVIFVSALNLIKTIKVITEIIGKREMSICKETTKINEHIIRGSANSVIKYLKSKSFSLKGEFTLIVSGKFSNKKNQISDTVEKELIKLLKKYNLTEVVKIVHSLTGISRKVIYQIAIKIKDG